MAPPYPFHPVLNSSIITQNDATGQKSAAQVWGNRVQSNHPSPLGRTREQPVGPTAAGRGVPEAVPCPYRLVPEKGVGGALLRPGAFLTEVFFCATIAPLARHPETTLRDEQQNDTGDLKDTVCGAAC